MSKYLLYSMFVGKQIRSYEAVDGKNPITAVSTMPGPHCSVVFGSADSVLRFIDPRKPGLQVKASHLIQSWRMHSICHGTVAVPVFLKSIVANLAVSPARVSSGVQQRGFWAHPLPGR